MAYNTILHERIGNHIHKITLNRPERLNAMTSELQLDSQLTETPRAERTLTNSSALAASSETNCPPL